MLKIVSVPNKVLSSPTKPIQVINKEIKNLVDEMSKTLVAQTDPMGVGLAANQVGVRLSLFIIKEGPEAPIKEFINPKIIKIIKAPLRKSKGKKSKQGHVKLEGCLSIPRIWGPVKRAHQLILQYQDLDGKTHEKLFKGFEATIIQHEMDHLSGIVFTQRSMEQEKQLYKEDEGELKPIEI